MFKVGDRVLCVESNVQATIIILIEDNALIRYDNNEEVTMPLWKLWKVNE
jgi:hypothetical protein